MIKTTGVTWENLPFETAMRIVQDIPIIKTKCATCRPNRCRGDLMKDLWMKEYASMHQVVYFYEPPDQEGDHGRSNKNARNKPFK